MYWRNDIDARSMVSDSLIKVNSVVLECIYIIIYEINNLIIYYHEDFLEEGFSSFRAFPLITILSGSIWQSMHKIQLREGNTFQMFR